ncbi:transposase [Marinifilum sp.]|uniref:transposase n=1 Tax=Marinifilum sp. TaxID=2033137 RepID=UPI003BAB40B1
MTAKFQNKYRIPSARWKDWDYASQGIYFVTICTNNREHYFGEITVKTHESGVSTTNNKNNSESDVSMKLSEIGELTHKFWKEIPKHFPFVQLHEFVIMPNHIHGMIEIKTELTSKLDVNTDKDWKPGTLGVMINQFKRICTINARKINPKFKWQTRFHDRVVRDFDEYHRIEQYIQNNPKNWENDNMNVETPY